MDSRDAPDRAGQRAAFRRATYGPPGERFGLGRALPARPPSWLEDGQTWAIVTAWNPAGQRRPDADNRRAGRALLAVLRGRTPLPGVNGEGEWAEPSVLLRGTSLREAAALGRRFGQAAVVFGVGRRAALVWLGDPAGIERWWAAPLT